MRLLVYVCPRTYRKVLAAVDDGAFNASTISVPMGCPVCKRTHLVDPADTETALPKQIIRRPKVQPHSV